MKIAIDGIAFSHPQPGGYHTYTSNLVNHLALIDDENEYLLLLNRPILKNPGINWRTLVHGTRYGGLSVVFREQLSIPHSLKQQKPDVFHSPCATSPIRADAPLVVTIYDTIEFTDPLPSPMDAKRWAMRVYSRYVQSVGAQRAKLVITISEYSKDQLVNHFGLPAERIVVTYLAPSTAIYQMDQHKAKAQTEQLFGTSGHVLVIASASSRKNTRGAIEAYARLHSSIRNRHPLVIVCTHASTRARLLPLVETFGLIENVFFVEQPKDQTLCLLYNAASLFVFPSLEEGFGLPPLEAMACGTPVVASNKSALPEILGDAALLVTATDTVEISEAIFEVLTSPSLSDQMTERGLLHSRQYSWGTTAKKTLEVYKSVANITG